MGAKSQGDPKIIARSVQQRQAWFNAMMEEQQRQADQGYRSYMDDMTEIRPPRPPDIYIAGQVFDGLTGELKRK